MKYTFCNKHEIAKLLGYSPHSLKAFRKNKIWVEEIHYIRKDSRTIRYNRELCLNWLININEPNKHQQAIEEYLQYVNSNQRVGSSA
jgi:hypothetical protein